MSDFDKFFREKLDEESHFPRRDKNWKALSNRLDAFQTGLQQQGTIARTYLRYWQAAATFAVVASAWLTWEMASTKSENAELRQEIAVLEEKQQAQQSEIAYLKSLPAATDKSQSNNPPSRFLDNDNNAEGVFSTQKRKSSSDAGNRNIAFQTAFSEKNKDEKSPALADLPAQADAFKNLTKLEKWSDFQSLPTDLLAATVLVSQSKISLPDSMAFAVSPNIIRPVRTSARFRVGVQAFVGVPQPARQGVSLLVGQGITAEYNVWRRFWLTASADWLNFDVSTKKYHPELHPPHHPPHPGGPWPGPFHKLTKVESAQRQQLFSLGVRYALPVRFWLQPSVRFAHTWTRVSPELISFRFEHPDPGGPGGPPPFPPKYKVQKSDAELLSSTWRLGVGLEHETPRWVAGLWADYSKSFSGSNPSFDMLLIRAGIQYRFN